MRKTIFVAGFAAIMAMFLFACDTGWTGAPSASEPEHSGQIESAEGRLVKMTAGDVEVVITLNDSQAAADFVGMLPLELTLIERSGFAKGMTLPRSLETGENTTREYAIGDFGYWAPGPDLALFYDDIYEQTIVPVIPMGKAEEDAENMRDVFGTVRLELLPEEEAGTQDE